MCQRLWAGNFNDSFLGDFVVGNRAVFYSKLIPGSVTAAKVKNAGHLLMYDQPHVVAGTILSFLKTT